MLIIGQAQLLPFKIHSNFNSRGKITNFFAIPIIFIIAPLKIFVLPCSTLDHVQSCLFHQLQVPLFYKWLIFILFISLFSIF